MYWIVMALAFIFVTPILFAFWHEPRSFTNHGELVQPARPLADVPLQSPQGGDAALWSLKGKWALIYIGEGACDERCRSSLYKINQLRLAQGKNAHRVRSVWLAPRDADDAARQRLRSEYPELTVMLADDPAMAELRRQFAYGEAPVSGSLYIVDPLGNLMMRYALDAEPRGMLKDLERLLRVSSIG
jgi:cytochrome oxidase Cu insertion factor (SCO1/SenC/PrrC family)